MDNEKISPLASGIMQGLQEAIADANGEPVAGTKKSVVFLSIQFLQYQH